MTGEGKRRRRGSAVRLVDKAQAHIEIEPPDDTRKAVNCQLRAHQPDTFWQGLAMAKPHPHAGF